MIYILFFQTEYIWIELLPKFAQWSFLSIEQFIYCSGRHSLAEAAVSRCSSKEMLFKISEYLQVNTSVEGSFY